MIFMSVFWGFYIDQYMLQQSEFFIILDGLPSSSPPPSDVKEPVVLAYDSPYTSWNDADKQPGDDANIPNTSPISAPY